MLAVFCHASEAVHTGDSSGTSGASEAAGEATRVQGLGSADAQDVRLMI